MPSERAGADEQVWSAQDAALSTRIQWLVAAPFTLFHPQGATQTVARPVRDRVFRLWVVPAYDHTCAVCGLRVLTPEGQSAVDAAHIVARSQSNNDDPRNGVALCGVPHWAFDRGLICVDQRNAIVLSRLVARADERAELLTRYHKASLRLPGEARLHPSAEAFAWHRAHVFRTTAA